MKGQNIPRHGGRQLHGTFVVMTLAAEYLQLNTCSRHCCNSGNTQVQLQQLKHVQ